MYIFVNNDIGLSPGAACAQTSHITQVLVDELVTDSFIEIKTPEHCIAYSKWKLNPVTVILKATYSELEELIKISGARTFTDEIDGVTIMTTVGFPPDCTKIGGITKKYKLYD